MRQRDWEKPSRKATESSKMPSQLFQGGQELVDLCAVVLNAKQRLKRMRPEKRPLDLEIRFQLPLGKELPWEGRSRKLQWIENCTGDEWGEEVDRAKLSGSMVVGEKEKEAKNKGSWVNKNNTMILLWITCLSTICYKENSLKGSFILSLSYSKQILNGWHFFQRL